MGNNKCKCGVYLTLHSIRFVSDQRIHNCEKTQTSLNYWELDSKQQYDFLREGSCECKCGVYLTSHSIRLIHNCGEELKI